MLVCVEVGGGAGESACRNIKTSGPKKIRESARGTMEEEAFGVYGRKKIRIGGSGD